MDIFIKAVAGVLVAAIVTLILAKQGKDFSVLLTITGCCMVAMAAIQYLQPAFTFIEKLAAVGQLNTQMIKILLKAVGISILAEFVSLLCADAGNSATGNMLQFMASAVILWLSIPLLNSLLDLTEEILSKV